MDGCPNCGSKSSQDGHRCDHCGGRVDHKLCRRCFYPNQARANFCMVCGSSQIHFEEQIILTEIPCPLCSGGQGGGRARAMLEAKPAEIEDLEAEAVIYNCPHCLGYWLEPAVCQAILAAAKKNRNGIVRVDRQRALEDKPYLTCPRPGCGEMLSRSRWDAFNKVPEARVAYPIVDWCYNGCGIWLDDGELEWVLDSYTA